MPCPFQKLNMLKKIKFRFLYIIVILLLILFLYLKRKNTAPRDLSLCILSEKWAVLDKDSVQISQLTDKLIEAGVGPDTRVILSASGGTSMTIVQRVQAQVDSMNPAAVLYRLLPEE